MRSTGKTAKPKLEALVRKMFNQISPLLILMKANENELKSLPSAGQVKIVVCSVDNKKRVREQNVT